MPSILITGCSSGIGLCAAMRLKERGYRVFASARKADDVQQLRSLGFADALQLDVTQADSIKQAIDFIQEQNQGQLDAVFNNAGFLQAGAIEDLTTDLERAQFETNVFGAMAVTRAVLPLMRKQGHGRIIQNSSILGIITLPYYGAYNASKFALEGFSNSLRQELRGTKIWVSIINPGPIKSNLRDNAFKLYQNTVQNNHSIVHNAKYQSLEANYFNNKAQAKYDKDAPDAVAGALIHALESKRPKAHYFVGLPAKSMALLHRFLPSAALDWILSRVS